jgi:hypothetical protein
MSSFIEIRPLGAELLHADERTDRRADVTKVIVAFRNFAKASKKIQNTWEVNCDVKWLTAALNG